MQDYQKAFIELARRNDVLKFGEFTLKSGRVSPYFFNAGAFASGAALAESLRAPAGASRAGVPIARGNQPAFCVGRCGVA